MNKPPRITPVARFLLNIRAIKAWRDGDGISFVWRWYHPVSWVAVPVSLCGAFVFGGIDNFPKLHELGIGLDRYWKDHKSEREFLS